MVTGNSGGKQSLAEAFEGMLASPCILLDILLRG